MLVIGARSGTVLARPCKVPAASPSIAALIASDAVKLMPRVLVVVLLRSNNFTVVNSGGVTWDSLSAPISKMRFSPTGVYSGEFDEVNLGSGVAERRKSDGTYQVSGYFDEYNPIV